MAARWSTNGDHPQDGVGQDVPDPLSGGTFQRVEGAVVRFYRHPNMPGDGECAHCGHIMHDHGWIDAREDSHVVCPGDWVITDMDGKRYPTKPDVFERTYEPVIA